MLLLLSLILLLLLGRHHVQGRTRWDMHWNGHTRRNSFHLDGVTSWRIDHHLAAWHQHRWDLYLDRHVTGRGLLAGMSLLVHRVLVVLVRMVGMLLLELRIEMWRLLLTMCLLLLLLRRSVRRWWT